MVPPVWLDEHGQRRKTRGCWKCGSEVPIMRYCTETLRQLGWPPCKTQIIVEWCGCSQEYVPWLEADGWWRMVLVLGEAAWCWAKPRARRASERDREKPALSVWLRKKV